MAEQISLLILLAGYIIGLGAVTVIDIHGFLGRKSGYWTRATIQTHKVTKPLIWVGTFLVLIGGLLFYRQYGFPVEAWYHGAIMLALILNGLFLSFWVSPRLLKQEAEGRAEDILPDSMQKAITVSFVISFAGWWGSLLLLVQFISNLIE